jgi:2,3-bisphosphoglycerate-independent phosphoglycerate mutase
MQKPKPVMLMILDGWGVSPAGPGNAVSLAHTPNLDRLLSEYPHTLLQTSGKAVGLPDGIMGNSEVGHLNIGAGRVVYQDLMRIDLAIEGGDFFKNPAFETAIARALDKGRTLHLIGLVSDGGVHSQLSHLLALLDLAKQKRLERVCVHVILDGRDTPPDAGKGYVAQLQAHLDKIGNGTIASICGRYYAMDRDTRWDRTERAYKLYTQGIGTPAQDAVAAVAAAYEKGETDEFVTPIVLTDSTGAPRTCMQDGDSLIFFNFRADRARQITRALTEKNFSEFERTVWPRLAQFVCMALYDEKLSLPVAFPPVHLEQILGEIVSRQGLRQLRIAETEKYAHVTYFFNGGEEKPFDQEDRCLIPSPRDVPTYDYKPQMSALAVTDEVLKRIAGGSYDLIVLNFANMDMVGHTGKLDAAIEAVQTVDQCVGRIVDAVLSGGGALLITADHGNAETMIENNGHVHTAHTTNPVHLLLIDDQRKQARLHPGVLGDIAPTILQLLALAQPQQMTGRSLLEA